MQERKASCPNTKSLLGFKATLAELRGVVEIWFRNYFRYPAWVIADIVTTPAWLILFIVPILMFIPRERWQDPTVLNVMFWAMVLWDVVSSGIWSFGMAIRREQQTGTLEVLFTTNASRAILFSGGLCVRTLTMFMGVFYMYAFFITIFKVELILFNPLGVLVSLVTGLVAALGFGLIYGSLVLRFKNVGPLNNIIQFILLGICGVFVPVTALPNPLRLISYTLPFTYVADLVRHHALKTEPLIPLVFEWLLLLAQTAIMLALGLFMLRKVENRMKRTGGLGTY
ncbi:MAG: ABC transporter permease [Thermofilaceae archaeon]